ncbi:hypothetical protein B0H12DRAFT_1122767, partial [Mycena haematopus]
MFYVIYVLAILCGMAFGLKIHTPPMAMVMANQAVEVKWSRQNNSDPTSVLFLLENLIGGSLTPSGVANSSQSSAETTTEMNFPDVGTFRMWAVNPADSTQSYAMSETFTVLPNNLAASSVGGGDNDDDSSDSLLPPPNSPGSAASSQSSVPASTSPASTNASNMKPYIIGAAIGGLVLLILVAVLVYIICRRRGRVVRRTTFHRNRMIRSLPPPTFAIPRDLEIDSPADEKGDMEGSMRRAVDIGRASPMRPIPLLE